MASTWIRLGSGPKRGLDRSVQKFDSVHLQLQELQRMSAKLFSQMQPYSKPGRGGTAAAAREPETAFSANVTKAKLATVSKPIDPSRLSFDEAPRFQAEKFLVDPLLRAGFRDPRIFRRHEDEWPRPKVARVQAPLDKQLQLYKKWDDVECLYLVPASSSEYRYRCGLFSVYKSDTLDRQILNPIPENSRSYSVSEATFSLAHSCLLCGIYIPPSQNLVINSDDLKDFYHGFRVTDQHASRNHLHGVFRGSDFAGWRCYKPELHDLPVVGCFRSLAMGTNFAVEVAQHAHANLLQRAGCLAGHERVAYKHVLPRGPGFDLLCIDDHVYLLLVPRGEAGKAPSPNRKDARLLHAAALAYAAAELRASPKKAIRNSYSGIVLGGQLDGIRGDLASPRLKTATLCALTMQLIVLGHSTPQLLQCILGSWIFVLMFRRPAMCILTQVFHEGTGCRGNEIFCLSQAARQELLLLVILAPCFQTDLRAKPLDALYCTDASPFAAGVCAARISTTASLELLRHADHRGFHTVLQPKLSAYLASFESPDFEADQPCSIPGQLTEGFLFDLLEVFRGEGNLSHVGRKLGLRVHPGFDIADGPRGDIMQQQTLLHIVGLIARRVVAYIHVAPPCTTFGTMVRPRLRSKTQPWGFSTLDPDTRQGNSFATRSGFILHLCAAYGLLCSCEQPRGSVMFRLDCFRRLKARGFVEVDFCLCTYGSPFMTPSRWLANNTDLLRMRGTCSCPLKDKHLRVGSTFTADNIVQFRRLCRPSSLEVFGRDPKPGEALCKFSGMCPLPAAKHLLDLQLPAINDLKARTVTLSRPAHQPPRWVADLGHCLDWKTIIQYRFRQLNHINVNEELSYRSLVKLLAKTQAQSRFGVLLDSRVTIGCNAKGRSSSATMNHYMCSCLPYILGGGLYPALFHIGTHDNVADDPSRLRALRKHCGVRPLWLERLLRGDYRHFDLVRRADDCSGAPGRWARLIVLKLICDWDAKAPPGLSGCPI